MTVKTSPVNIEERKNLDLRVGDRVRVWQKIVEKGKTRLQPFEGLVLCHRHGKEAGATFTVRRVSQGIGVERIFPLYSPNIDRIEILRRSKVRRAKLYYIREKVAREARRKLRKSEDINISTKSEAEAAAEEVEAQKVEENAPEDLEVESSAEVQEGAQGQEEQSTQEGQEQQTAEETNEEENNNEESEESVKSSEDQEEESTQ